MRQIRAQVAEIFPLTDSIIRLVLVPDTFIEYHAGQYLQIIDEDEVFSYSIANAPLGSHKYELHIRHSRENPYNQRLFAHIKEHGYVTLQLPYGTCSINHLDKNRSIIFIAAGTGFAPVKAMIEQLLAAADPRAFELFWVARTKSDLYWDEKVCSWNTHVKRFNYFSYLADVDKETIASYVLQKHPKDIRQWQTVISGPFDMVYNTRDALVKYGMDATQLFSDAFSFESKS